MALGSRSLSNLTVVVVEEGTEMLGTDGAWGKLWTSLGSNTLAAAEEEEVMVFFLEWVICTLAVLETESPNAVCVEAEAATDSASGGGPRSVLHPRRRWWCKHK